MRTNQGIHELRCLIGIGVISTSLFGCGGGGNNTGDSMPASQTPVFSGSTTATTPSIQWISPSKSDSRPLSRDVQLQARAVTSINGISKVDFFVDGVLIDTQTIGLKQPGVPDFDYNTSWRTAGYADGPHTIMARVTDKANLTAETETLVVSIQNNITVAVILSTDEIFPTPSTAAQGTGQLALNLATGVIAGEIELSNVVATAVHVHSGFATASGDTILTLQQDQQSKHWVIPSGSAFTTVTSNSQINSLLSGGLYVDAHSSAYPDGEIRAQLLPNNIAIAFSRLSGDQEIPPVSTMSSGVAAVTLDSSLKRFQVNVRLLGVTNLTAVGVYQGGALPTMDNWRFFVRADATGNLVASGSTAIIGQYNPTLWYLNVITTDNPNGLIRGPFPIVTGSN